jgi:hypothetical protein
LSYRICSSLLEPFSPADVFFSFIHLFKKVAMSSPWDPAIAQAMQRHGGSNRSVPNKAQIHAVLTDTRERVEAAKPQENREPDVLREPAAE